MVLKSDVVAERLRRIETKDMDPLIISPQPDLDELKESGAAAVDLRLGTWLRTLRQSKLSLLQVNDTTDDSPPHEAQLTKTHFVPFGKDFYLHPRAFVLGVSLEWLRIPSDMAGYVIGRSKWGRRGLIIATATGVHPGFTGCLTLEITNVGSIPMAIRPGMRICQLFLHQAEVTGETVHSTTLSAHRRPVLGHVVPDRVAKRLSMTSEDLKQ